MSDGTESLEEMGRKLAEQTSQIAKAYGEGFGVATFLTECVLDLLIAKGLVTPEEVFQHFDAISNELLSRPDGHLPMSALELICKKFEKDSPAARRRS